MTKYVEVLAKLDGREKVEIDVVNPRALGPLYKTVACFFFFLPLDLYI